MIYSLVPHTAYFSYTMFYVGEFGIVYKAHLHGETRAINSWSCGSEDSERLGKHSVHIYDQECSGWLQGV